MISLSQLFFRLLKVYHHFPVITLSQTRKPDVQFYLPEPFGSRFETIVAALSASCLCCFLQAHFIIGQGREVTFK
jgi:hypothetical protein